jgi:hypothetical protein
LGCSEFQKYDNTLGFFVGNEVIAQASQSLAATFIKAAARDMKAYRDSKGYRTIPVGYSAADIAELRPMLQDFLTCGGNASDSVDFFALNSYEWCGDVDFDTSGYANLQAGAANFPVPIFFSETGCNTARPRTFEDQAAIFGEKMINDWVCPQTLPIGPQTNPIALALGRSGCVSAAVLDVTHCDLDDETRCFSAWSSTQGLHVMHI